MGYYSTSSLDIKVIYELVENERVKSEHKHKIDGERFCRVSDDCSVSDGSVLQFEG